MTWRTHTEGGSWTGGGHQVPNCSVEVEQPPIVAAFNYLHNTSAPAVLAFGGLDSLGNCLNGKTVQGVDIDCHGSGCNGAYGTSHVGGNDINLCNPALPPAGVQTDTDVTVFHELVHDCGGVEIDAWSMENTFYNGHGTILPGPGVVAGFMGETSSVGGGLRAATFVVWENATGRVFVKVSTGGSWDSGPTITRGRELPVNNAVYKFP